VRLRAVLVTNHPPPLQCYDIVVYQIREISSPRWSAICRVECKYSTERQLVVAVWYHYQTAGWNCSPIAALCSLQNQLNFLPSHYIIVTA